jgi:hypothetical protein
MSTGISEEFKTATKSLSPESQSVLATIRSDAAAGKYTRAAELITKFIDDPKTTVSADQIKGFARISKMPLGHNTLAGLLEPEINKDRQKGKEIKLSAADVAFFEELDKDRTSELIAFMAKVSGKPAADVVSRMNSLAKPTTPAPATLAAAPATTTPPAASTGSNPAIGSGSFISQGTFKLAAHNPTSTAAIAATAAEEKAKADAAAKAAEEKAKADAEARTKADAAKKERDEKVQKERAEVQAILDQLNRRKTKEAAQTGGLLSMVIGQFADGDLEKSLTSPGMAEARKRGVKVAEGGMGLIQMASLFVGRGPIMVPVSMVESIKDRMVSEFGKDPNAAIDKLLNVADPADQPRLKQLKSILNIAEQEKDPAAAAEMISSITKRVITKDHVDTLKLALSKDPKDKEQLTNDRLLEALLSFDPGLNKKMDEQAALIGGGMMREYLRDPGMLIDKIVGTLKEFIPGFGQFFEMLGNGLKSVANTVIGAFTPKA